MERLDVQQNFYDYCKEKNTSNIYDKIDNSNKFRRLKDIVCYSDHYCVPTPEFVSRNLSDL